eukprot:scaffold38558_cov145-Amphora_coffeaeformis.AAC.1
MSRVAPLFASSKGEKSGKDKPTTTSSANGATVDTDAADDSTTTTTTAWDELSDAGRSLWETIRDAPERYRIQQDLILMGASYDRGFGASPSARQKVNEMVKELITMNPCQDAARDMNHRREKGQEESPLQGNWRLVWTTAQDILALNASPFTTVGAIHQVVEPPIITNIVDLIPRAQELVAPDKILSTLFRGKVKNKAQPKNRDNDSRMILDVTFESVNIKAVEVLGRKTGSNLPAFGLNLPKLPGAPSNNNGRDSSTRQLEIVYVDNKMMITQQKAPGGTNVFVKVDDAEV